MPIYEFQCEKCEHEFEELVLRRDEAVQCPNCESDRLKKLFSGFAVTGSARRVNDSSCGSCQATPSKCSSCGVH